ncbi:FAD-dependent oxidoreductase [Synechococcus sp. PCC 7502]|uniref:FAD-dependent oxidoreductase n=1 Tax=Synechococcus sp. PCC 7502 TaxID=1173263 RepID=UPI00059CBD92|nr:FAD-dependent oxidoreductase [Synechococcus sp. PCC 7502]
MKIRRHILLLSVLIAQFSGNPVLAAITCPNIDPKAKSYDVIVFGDEVPGVMTAIQVQRELKQRNQSAKVGLITEGNIKHGIGGHLVRGGLAYLDRNQIPRDMRSRLGKFAPTSRLYQEFLDITKTETIALDRFKAAAAFKQVLAQAKIDVIGNVKLKSVLSAGNSVCSFTVTVSSDPPKDTIQQYTAQQFIDASQGGKFAEMAGVKMLTGFGALGLPDSSLGIGLAFETYGLTIKQLRRIELKLIRRFLDTRDQEAQTWLKVASGNNPKQEKAILVTLLTSEGNPRTLYQGTNDSADVRSLAFTTAFHGQNNLSIQNPEGILDRANIAVLDDRLSYNAMLFYTTAETALKLSNSGAKPEPYMQAFAEKVKRFYLSLGATKVEIMKELYIRTTAQIANPIEELSATVMTEGGIPADEALGTFTYHLDVRGGIKGLRARATSEGVKNLDLLNMPTFNYGFRHTLPQERQNLAVLGPTSGFGGLGTAAGRIVEFNVSVGEGLAIAIAKAITENRSLHSIKNREVRRALGYTPIIYGRPTESFNSVFFLEKTLKTLK